MLTTVTAVLFLIVFLADLFGWHTNPYLGILFFLIMPTFFVFGLLLIPLGAWIDRRRRRKGKAPLEVRWPSVDFNDPQQRAFAGIVLLGTCANVIIISLATYRGVQYMDSVQFCGQVCHEVMKPEFAAYQDSPHSRVACVECHIGPGASWFARSKVSGTRQVFAVMLNTFPRPIPSPVQNLRPAREVCEQCHWPRRVPRGQARAHLRVRRRRGQHGERDDAAGARGRRERPAGRGAGDSLAHEPRQPDRVHHHRRQARGDSLACG